MVYNPSRSLKRVALHITVVRRYGGAPSHKRREKGVFRWAAASPPPDETLFSPLFPPTKWGNITVHDCLWSYRSNESYPEEKS